MEDTTGISVLDRLKIASGSTTDAELADNLKLTKQSIAQARAKKSVPAAWIPKAAELFAVSTDWLFFGRGPMRPGHGQSLPEANKNAAHPAEKEDVPCPQCAESKAEMEIEKEERRALCADNRELSAENRRLWKENAALRERCATLTAYLGNGNLEGDFKKTANIPSSDAQV